MKDRRLASLDAVLKALADPTRLRIIGLLASGEVCVCHIHESLGIPQPKTSRHLAYLRRAGLVEGRKDGLWVHYRLAAMEPVIQAVVDAAAHALGHLQTTERDRRRLSSRVSLAPVQEWPVIRPCCAPAGSADLPDCCD
jgi:ArsR family transcriptional regulator, arsenate/arsenite/antimonite-responsive transcriptional repressor